jgi:hypothetical protein
VSVRGGLLERKYLLVRERSIHGCQL